jgi:hypothetical protein
MKIAILKCAVCGHSHANIRVDKLPEPIDRFTHAGACNLTGDVIYIRFIDETLMEFFAPAKV